MTPGSDENGSEASEYHRGKRGHNTEKLGTGSGQCALLGTILDPSQDTGRQEVK